MILIYGTDRTMSDVQVLDRVVGVLRALEDGPCSLAELVVRTGLPRATAHRLATAEALDWPPGGGASLDGGRQHPGPILAAMTQLARDSGVHLLLGGFPERSDAPPQIRNTSVLVAPAGRVVARYRMMHLVDVDLPGGVRFR